MTQQRLTARVQGPFDGHEVSVADQQRLSGMLFFSGGSGITAVTATVQRCAYQRRAASLLAQGPPLLPLSLPVNASR